MQGGASGPSLRKDTEAYEENNEMESFVIDAIHVSVCVSQGRIQRDRRHRGAGNRDRG